MDHCLQPSYSALQVSIAVIFTVIDLTLKDSFIKIFNDVSDVYTLISLWMRCRLQIFSFKCALVRYIQLIY